MAAPQQQSNQQDSSFNLIWGIAAIFAVFGVIWFAFKNQIVEFFLLLKLYEVNMLGAYFHTSYFEQLRNVILYAMANPEKVQFNELLLIGNTVGNWFRIPLAILFFFLGIVVYSANATRVFRQKYSMHLLRN